MPGSRQLRRLVHFGGPLGGRPCAGRREVLGADKLVGFAVYDCVSGT